MVVVFECSIKTKSVTLTDTDVCPCWWKIEYCNEYNSKNKLQWTFAICDDCQFQVLWYDKKHAKEKFINHKNWIKSR